jgi:hypothetical protein
MIKVKIGDIFLLDQNTINFGKRIWYDEYGSILQIYHAGNSRISLSRPRVKIVHICKN